MKQKIRDDLVYDLVAALAQVQTFSETALFLQDLLTQKEIQNLSKRLRIAKLLLDQMTYEEIELTLDVSHGTIAKIAAWLSEKGDGFRNIIAKLPKNTHSDPFKNDLDWNRIKRKYSLYFWPELLLEEVVKSANKKQKERIRSVLANLQKKNDLHRKIEQLLKSSTT